MKFRKLELLLCTLIFISAFVGCGNNPLEESNSEADSTKSTLAVASGFEAGTFQIDAVCSSVNIHNHMFTVPQKLSELSDGLTYAFIGEEFDDGLYEVEVSDSSGVILRSIAENAHKKSSKASLYNIALTDSESDVLGITPLVSTKEDVIKQFGDPMEQKQSNLGDKKIEVFIYGTHGVSTGYQTDGQFMNIAFNEDNIVFSIVINYTE